MKNSKGQSSIEFILTFATTVGFILLFLKMALNYTNGYIVQHAVYMASRAYLVDDSDVGSSSSEASRDAHASAHAKEIFKKYLPTDFVQGLDNDTLKLNDPDTTKYTPFIGAWIEFKQLFSTGFIGGKDLVVFRAESFLGREPTRKEGFAQTCRALMDAAGISDCNKTQHVTLDDNGG